MSDRAITIDSDSAEATHEIGRRLGAVLAVGDVVALVGPLGAGKTRLVKGIADGAGVRDLRAVNSPTFVIVNQYEAASAGGRLCIHHVDTYRLRDGGDLEALGFDEMCAGGAVVIEWADRVADILPPDVLTITIEPTGDDTRVLRAEASGPGPVRLLDALGDRSRGIRS